MEPQIPTNGEQALPTDLPARPFRITDALVERLWNHGAATLNDAELLALMMCGSKLRSNALDIAYSILHQCDGRLLELSKRNIFELSEKAGLSRQRTAVLYAAFELGMRRLHEPPVDRTAVFNSHTAYELLRSPIGDLVHEEFWVLHLDRGKRLIARERVSLGGMHHTIADPKMIFKMALDRHASSIVVAHNHPSGQCRPSEEDIQLTKKLVQGSKLLDIGMDDHVIVTQCGYYSFADNGML